MSRQALEGHTVECYPVIKRNELLSYEKVRRKLRGMCAEGRKATWKGCVPPDSSYLTSWKRHSDRDRQKTRVARGLGKEAGGGMESWVSGQ